MVLIADVADWLGVTTSTVRAYMAREQMPQPSGHFGRTPFWVPADIDPWLTQRCGARFTTTQKESSK
jgi:predicted DNA-binding transcriptional regulator AlpA